MSSQRRARNDDKRLGRFYFPLPAAPAPRNPVVAAGPGMRCIRNSARASIAMYGQDFVYAATKRQLSRREVQARLGDGR